MRILDMKKSVLRRAVVLVCVAVLSLGAVGCANPALNAATSEQAANRSYMSQVNEVMDDLGSRLEAFVDAVSRGDVVNMRTQADNAYKALDELAELEPPEGLSDIQEKYTKGADKLREALNAYIALYTEMSGGAFEQSAYDAKIAEVQKLYDEGVRLLDEGDKAAADKS